MRAYELMVIFESGLDDLVIDDQVKSVTAQIATRGGTVASTDRWGRRRFAYEIDHKTEGYYVVWELTSDGVLRLVYRGGDAGRAHVVVTGKGSSLPSGIPAALASTSQVTVQCRSSDGLCLSIDLDEIQAQDSNSFKAK